MKQVLICMNKNKHIDVLLPPVLILTKNYCTFFVYAHLQKCLQRGTAEYTFNNLLICHVLTGEGLYGRWDPHLADWSDHRAAAAVMDLKERRHRTLTHARCAKDFQFTTSSLDNDECRVPTQKSYSSSETLKAFDHDSRLHYGGCVADLVHHEADEFTRQGGNTTSLSVHIIMYTVQYIQ